MKGVILNKITDHIGGEEPKVISHNVDYSNKTFKHVLLPLWISAYRYKGTVYQFVINAQTGKITGNSPTSSWKKI